MKVTREAWIGLFEVRPLEQNSQVLEGAKGAFVNIVGLADGETSFHSLVAHSLSDLGLKVVNSEDLGLLDQRVAQGSVIPEIVALATALSEESPVLFDEFQAFDETYEH